MYDISFDSWMIMLVIVIVGISLSVDLRKSMGFDFTAKLTESTSTITKSIEDNQQGVIDRIDIAIDSLAELKHLMLERMPTQPIIEIRENGCYCIVLNSKNKADADEAVVQEIKSYFRENNAEVMIIVSNQ